MEKKHLYITTVIIAVSGLVASMAQGWFMQKEPDVRYFLSDPIPFRFGGDEGQAVQQLTVTNKGEAAATGLRIKLPPRIADHQLEKAYESDTPIVSPAKGSFEVLYPRLPRQGQFRLIIKTDGTPINRSDMTIEHDTGSAIDALTAGRSIISQLITPMLTLAIWGFIPVFMLWDVAVSIWKSKAEGYDTWITVLKHNAPWYITSSKWVEIRALAIATCKCIEAGSKPLSESSYYRILNEDKPNYLESSEWELLRRTVNDKFDKELSERSSRIWSADDVIKLLGVERPVHFPQSQWAGFIQALWAALLVQKKRLLFTAAIRPDTEAIRELVFEPAPEGVDPKLWKDWLHEVRETYKSCLQRDLSYQKNPIEFLQKHDLTLLAPKQREDLEDYALNKALIKFHRNFAYLEPEKMLAHEQPSWMPDSVFQYYRELAEKVVSAEKSGRAGQAILRNLSRIAACIGLEESDKNELPHTEWEKLTKLHSDIVSTMLRVQANEVELVAASESTRRDRLNVLRQLEILRGILEDPDSVLNIEEYDNPFAPGNFDMLKVLATKLKGKASGDLCRVVLPESSSL